MNWLGINLSLAAKYLVVELAPPYAQSAWRSGGKMVRTAGLAACCNYLLKRKKKIVSCPLCVERLSHQQ